MSRDSDRARTRQDRLKVSQSDLRDRPEVIKDRVERGQHQQNQNGCREKAEDNRDHERFDGLRLGTCFKEQWHHAHQGCRQGDHDGAKAFAAGPSGGFG